MKQRKETVRFVSKVVTFSTADIERTEFVHLKKDQETTAGLLNQGPNILSQINQLSSGQTIQSGVVRG